MRANATHFFNNSIAPIKISKTPTVFKTYPVAPRDVMKLAAFSGNSGKGIKPKNLFAPNKTSIIPNTILTILVNIEFINISFID